MNSKLSKLFGERLSDVMCSQRKLGRKFGGRTRGQDNVSLSLEDFFHAVLNNLGDKPDEQL